MKNYAIEMSTDSYIFSGQEIFPFQMKMSRKTCISCRICAELKPQFYQRAEDTLINATGPMQRISFNFKGPLPNATRNQYLLVIVDEYARFSFLYACTDMQTSIVINCLELLFRMSGMPVYIHSDRSLSFIPRELKEYVLKMGCYK